MGESASTSPGSDPAGFLAGGGELGALIRDRDWSKTLGPPASWSNSIKLAVSLCLQSRFPILLWVGPELRILYNDAYVPFLGAAKHPAMLGAPGKEAWAEIWDDIAPMLAEATAGRATWVEDYRFFFDRELPREETYVTFSYSPIFGADAEGVEGVFCVCTETTRRVVGERRLSTLHALGVTAPQQRTADDACRDIASVLQDNAFDIAFAAVYLCDRDGAMANRAAVTQLASDASAFPPVLQLAAARWPLAEAGSSGHAVIVPDIRPLAGTVAAPLWPDPVRTAVVLPLPAPTWQQPAGFLIIGTSPRQVLDAEYRNFLELVAEHAARAIAGGRAFEDERRRAEALAALDRAKTAFFSNVSHEFRTPLTLVLGPLRELLAKPAGALPPDAHAMAEIAERNGSRLLRLVNSLLDFSRIEAGRAQACYEPTDLPKLTAELAASFQSACDSAGLVLEIACLPLPEPVYVDRDMWEKIVLNLVSNAFKFTFDGHIAVGLRTVPAGVELRVVDSGVGIPAGELPRLFERFHRVEGQRSRSHEGSGIGLALIQELTRLHGGGISVESREGEGTIFTVTIPFGTTHLPADQVGRPRSLASTATGGAAFLEEARRWLPGSARQAAASAAGQGPMPGPRILVADDNADMRDYLVGLLTLAGWSVDAVADGDAALAAARLAPPDLLLADVMMPGRDGLALVAALRQAPRLATMPAILLSARAGEEARMAGMRSGADDYMVKPFSARELIARVEALLALTRLRQETNERLRRSDARLQAAVDLVGLSPYRWDPAADTLEWDDRLRGMWGLPPGVPVDKGTFLRGIHPQDRPQVEAAIAACTDPAGDGVYHLEYRVIGIGDGVERWVSTHGQTTFEDGRAVDFVGAALDVTERRRVEERLRASEERFRHFAEHSADLLWIVDVEAMRIEYRSPAVERIWGVPRDAVPDDLASWAETIHPDDRAAVLDSLRRVQQGEPAVQEFRVLRPDGAVRWVRDTAFSIRDELGRVHRIGGITVDITRVEGAWIYVVDGGEASRLRIAALLQGAGYDVKTFATPGDFLEVAPMLLPGCAVLDLGGCGEEALVVPRELKARGIDLPVIVVAGEAGDVRTAVQALKAGAADWLEGSHDPQDLLAAVAAALAKVRDAQETGRRAEAARLRIAGMSQREREVLEGIVAGETNKEIARRLGISPRTVEIHRAHVMERLGVRSLSEAVLLAAAAGLAGPRAGAPK
ncbi:response regulator [Paracraurococcus lichenis]|uniref:histidine kinase n=1 Tax=Paracraurococcus lichenis TaxID=3064888 RepID=A0ABT9E769_9PROT|nr:response regulator [Paracraurococcus sp. LOR1-02]MDO9711905.1 response regulator [Paracraurococcus sp. LOR1-02]